jgi:hypothetical protein
LETFSESWPKWGTMLGGKCYLPPTSALRTFANVYSSSPFSERLWPTPKSSPSGPDFARMNREGSGGDDLATAVERARRTAKDAPRSATGTFGPHKAPLPTPSATPYGSSWNGTGNNKESRGRPSLDGFAKRFPTPRTEDSQCAGGHRGKDDTLYGAICRPKESSSETPPQEEIGLWPTPTASDGKRNAPNMRGNDSLPSAAQKWTTPTAGDSEGGRTTSKGKEFPTSLNAAVRGLNPKYPTPTVGDSKGSGSRNLPGSKAHPGISLTDAIVRGQTLPTPRTKGMCGGTGNFEQMKKLEESGAITEKERRQMTAGNGGQLNPRWVEWLMGWPIGWTALDSAAMESFQLKPSRSSKKSSPTSKS